MSANVVDASLDALVDAFEYKLLGEAKRLGTVAAGEAAADEAAVGEEV